jgi:hypothetical protein
MTDIHIDDFYKDVALIFLSLYKAFPRKIVLYVDDISGSDQPDEFGLPSERFLAGFSAMVWLGEHGYLKYDAVIKQEAVDQAVLTEQGLLLLSSRSELNFGEALTTSSDDISPSVMEESQTNINQLRKAIKSGSSIMIRQCVQYMLNTTFYNN